MSFLNASGAVQASYSSVSAFSRFTQTVNVPSAGVYYIRVIFDTASFSYSDRQYAITATFAPLVPMVSTQPTDQNVFTGSTATFSVTASGIPPLSYQWLKNSVPISGATNSSLRFASAASTDAGTYSATIKNVGGTAISSSAVLTVIPLPNPSRLINLSVLTAIVANQPLAMGFVVNGTGLKRVLVRAIGPTLSIFGVANVVSDPRLNLFNEQGTIIGSNDNWQPSDFTAMFQAGAFALPTFSRDAVLIATLSPGNYTVQVSGVGSATGSVLVEVYEAP